MEAFHIFRLASKPVTRGRSSRLHVQLPHAHLPGAGIAFPHLQAPPPSRISERNHRMASLFGHPPVVFNSFWSTSDVASQLMALVTMLRPRISSYDQARPHTSRRLPTSCLLVVGSSAPNREEKRLKCSTSTRTNTSQPGGVTKPRSFLTVDFMWRQQLTNTPLADYQRIHTFQNTKSNILWK
ncbi:hypothetical protein NM208_g11949 [Fusarium decemcellulare]|uniref:Uncharacterized protein n=1 Tax=Fusarium decemcellulare TaxID=57161 RepID=A0ACC1RSH0_9HYPO|nr:hypothetical protein NM208_g11949 [Fusarium decemcellulare]